MLTTLFPTIFTFLFLQYYASVLKPSKPCSMFSVGWESILCMSALLL